jgi:hypothetical protein
VNAVSAWWQPWTAVAGFAFLLNFIWEMWQAPFYRTMVAASHLNAVLVCSLATVGDAAITVLAFGVAAAIVRNRGWLFRPAARPVAVYLGVGLGLTVLLEWLNVHVWQRFAYAPVMPTVFGIGLTPLIQWLVLPPVALWLSARHVSGGEGSLRGH